MCRKYEGHFFYDTNDRKVHVAVPEDMKHVVREHLEEFRRRTFVEYQIDEPVESWYHPTCGTNLRAGSPISNITGQCFMFSGTVFDERTGITVAHALKEGEDVRTFRNQYGEVVRPVIGKCRKTFRDVQIITERSEFTMTADMAVLDLLPDFHVRRNLVQLPENERKFRLRIYKGPRLFQNTKVMVIDKMGRFHSGVIRRERFTDTSLERRGGENLYNVLGIGSETRDGMPESPITGHGDSGALVLSTPSENSDVLDVYGIVIGLYGNGPRDVFTIANCLGEVISKVVDIDFTDRDKNDCGFETMLDNLSDVSCY